MNCELFGGRSLRGAGSAPFEFAVGLVGAKLVENQFLTQGLGGIADDGTLFDDDGAAVDRTLDEATLATMTVEELKAVCEKKGIDAKKLSKKSDLIEALVAKD